MVYALTIGLAEGIWVIGAEATSGNYTVKYGNAYESPPSQLIVWLVQYAQGAIGRF